MALERNLSLIADIDHDIAIFQNSLSLYPRSHSEHINCVYSLSELQWERYRLSREKEDLDKSIVHCTKAILLPHISRNGPFLNNVSHLVFHLASTLLERSETFERPKDVKYSIEYFRYLLGLPLDPLDDSRGPSRNLVTRLLNRALSIQVKSRNGDYTPSIKDRVVFCRLIMPITSKLSTDLAIAPLRLLSEAANAEFTRGLPIELLDEVIECLRDAVKVCPQPSFHLLFGLAVQLHNRFMATHSLDDYEEGTAQLERILNPNRLEGCPDLSRGDALQLSTSFAISRWDTFGTPEYSEVAISRLRALLSSSFVDEYSRFQFTDILSTLCRERFKVYGISESLEEANSNLSQVISFGSSQSLETPGRLLGETSHARKTYSMTALQQKILHLKEILSKTPPGTGECQKDCLTHLAHWYETKFHHTDNISDIEESIKYYRLSLDANHDNSPWRYRYVISLCRILLLAFEKTRRISYLNESITIGYDILELKTPQQDHLIATRRLASSLLSREELLGRIEDRHEAIRLISVATDNQYAQEPDRFRLACEWAVIARRISHPTTLTAYKSAMALMQKYLSFAPTISIQHTRLVTMCEHCRTMPLDYASFQMHLSRFGEAVETLEQGRALLWSEMRGFRTSVAQLIEEDSSLAKRLTEINQELEALTMSATPSGRPEIEDGFAQGGNGTDPFGRLVITQKKLMEERDALISQIQSRPGLEGFSKAPTFRALRSAASRGPVIIINHSIWRSDIAMIFSNSFHFYYATPKNFYSRSNKLRDKLVEARKRGLDSHEYQDALSSVLKVLYELIGAPVIERLRLAGVPEQSRIWWCPTSVFCSLPLHAMGPIPSSDGREQYFSDLYIPSYTPSLSALIECRRESLQTSGKPSLLLVAQPEDSLPGVKGEIKVIRKLEERATVVRLVSSKATPSSVVECLQGSRLAHFACHGVLEAGKPFDASFKLHDGSRLTLLEIVRSRLPDAEFAFLSCCHAAEITEDSVADEMLHLTAAMQYCGFRSVVGTMWEMADTDGKDLAKSFYKSLFSSQETDTPYYDRSARALRDATQKLRGKRGITLERWVNFVHYGA
ncbi:CHAT domain-containing protein [Lactarius quietus]|nr:CHAT domain-containing protein [Lactarius quietus]